MALNVKWRGVNVYFPGEGHKCEVLVGLSVVIELLRNLQEVDGCLYD